MRSKLLTGAAALAITAGAIAASAQPAAARWGGWHGGWGWGAAGIAAAAVGAGVAAATAPGYYDYYPGYSYGPGYYDYAPGPAAVAAPVAPAGGAAYCAQRFRSYNPATGMYLGYDGQYHPCP